MDSIAEFIDHECSVEADLKYPAAKLYEAYRHYCQAIGLKPPVSYTHLTLPTNREV